MEARVRLIEYLDTLPVEKVLEGDERYIDYIDSYTIYPYILRLATSLGRINNKDNDLFQDGYSIDKFEKVCKVVSDKKEYDAEYCSDYYSQGVTNWQELCGYHILFLLGRVPGTPTHPAPWNKETMFIIDPLARILNSTILTLDSQPGLLVDLEDTKYVQKPYLKIAGPCDRLHRILNKLFSAEDTDTSMVQYVPYGLEETTIEDYANYRDKQDVDLYGAIYLGMATPDVLTIDYVDYILSNRFFEAIARIIEITG